MILGILVGCSNSQKEIDIPTDNTSINQTQPTQETEDTVMNTPENEIVFEEEFEEESFSEDYFEYVPSDEVIELEEAGVPFVSLYCDTLGMSASGYENQNGALFLKVTNPDEQFYICPSNTAQYYWGTNEVLIGVRNNKISLVLSYASSQVRDVINSIGATALFEIQPAVQKVSTWYNSQYFFYWKIENGYIGFIAIGGDDPLKCYDYAAHSIIYFEDLNDINISKSISDNEIELTLAPDDYYLYPENFEIYHSSNTEYGENVILTPQTEIHNFKFFVLDGEKLLNNNQFIILETLFTCDSLTSTKPFVTTIYYEGPLGPYYGISYEDESGNQHNFVIYESGMDGSFYLEAF